MSFVDEPTEAETGRVLWLLRALDAEHVVVGSSRDAPARHAAAALGAAWSAAGGTVLDTVDWPEHAASWLRQARRFTAHGPDAWVVTGTAAGWLPMARRLAAGTGWSPARTVATATLDVPAVHEAPELFGGLLGATGDGLLWRVD